MVDTRRRRRRGRRRPGSRSLTGVWAAFLAPLVAIGLLVAYANLTRPPQPQAGGTAPDFSLPDTDGGTVHLGEILGGGDALLYFSMGVGCDGCFLQILEIGPELSARGIALVPIMVGRTDRLAAEAARFDLDVPIVVDAERRVSSAYGMLGWYGHGDVPSHSFALVRRDGEIAWVRHYAEMFVSADRFFAELPR